eukprot:7322636-Prymnesium_polylepis.2
MLGAPSRHDGGDEEDEQDWPEQITLLDNDDGEESRNDTVDLELDDHRLVEGNQQVDDLGRHTVLAQHGPQQLTRHAVEGLHQVDEEDPCLQPMFAPFGNELLDREDGVGTGSLTLVH